MLKDNPLPNKETLIEHGRARDAAKRLIDWYFGNEGERPRIAIPARPDHDDDLVLCAYIEQQAALSKDTNHVG